MPTKVAKSRPLKLYVGCALTHTDEEFRAGIEKLKRALRAEGYDVLDFLWVRAVNPTPKDVFEWDIQNCVKECDAMVAICDHPSLGLGYELGEAANLKKPILALAQEKTKITRLILGAAEVLPNLEFKRYKDISADVIPIVDQWLSNKV